MSRACTVDVLVIGLGPAGAMAAASAARAGLRVLAIDCKKRAGVPVQCAEWIPQALGRFAQGPGVSRQRITGMLSHLPQGVGERSNSPGLMVDRAAFDQALVADAANAGADIRFDARLLVLTPLTQQARIREQDGVRDVEYRVLIAADGPRSRVASELGLPVLETVRTRQYTVPLLTPATETEVWLSPQYPGGYAWLFPKGAWANLGLGADHHLVPNLKAPLDEMHRHLICQGRVGVEIAKRTGGEIPVAGLRAQLVVGNAVFVGDAGGFTHPITGAGIAAAIASGARGGEAAACFLVRGETDALAEYETDMREQFEPALARAVARRRWLAARLAEGGGHSAYVLRRGWVAFPEYFQDAQMECAL